MQRAAAFTVLAMLAFAANSLLARAAIGFGVDGAPAIGPLGFTSLRLAAGALVLWPWWRPRRPRAAATAPARATAAAAAATATPRASTRRVAAGALALVAYALPFSLAYVALGAATGALLLFGAVQLTMIAAGLRAGERLDRPRVLGLLSASLGLTILLAPGLQAPPIWAAATMLVAGAAWGAYSLIGRGEADPVAATARNFAWALPAAALMAAWPGAWTGVSATGVALALVSGALASGLGYVVWYLALPALPRTVAATVQLAVPLVAALGGVALLGEPIDTRLALAAILVLGGIAAVVLPRR